MAEIGVMKKLTIGGSTYTIPEYSLPIASASTLGGVKIGTGLSINSTTGVLSATGLDFDEADPVFTASVAYGITQADIDNWNSKTSNTGTVTSVRVQASDPLQSSVSDAQSNTLNTTISFKNQNKNLVLAGPSTGSAAAPTFRSLVADDIPISDWAKATSKPSYNFSEIGLKPTTLSGYGITDAYTKTQVDGLVAGVLHYKGTKASVANLPTTGNITGDVWHITADGSEYAWDGSIWQELGTAVDLSGYALKSEIPTVPTSTGSNTTGITASTTATKTSLGTASSIYGVKSGTNSTTTASKASGSNGSASNWVFEDVACDDITDWSAGSGSASFSATVSSHVLSFSHSHTHTAPSLTYSAKTASHVKSGGNGTAPSWSFTDVTVPIRADSATSVPSVSVASATVSITDPGHTHTI